MTSCAEVIVAGSEPAAALPGRARLEPADAERLVFAAALRELADFLESHPDVPVPMYAEVRTFLGGVPEADRVAEVERIAAILGRPTETRATHYLTRRVFGPTGYGITYQACHIPDSTMAAHEAYASYSGAVQP